MPHTPIDIEAHWTKSGWHGWVYGWKLHLGTCATRRFILGAVFVYQLTLLYLSIPHRR